MTQILGYKGLDKDFKCKNFQFEVGKTFTESSVKVCGRGFHLCENPLDVLQYYNPADSRFALVRASGDIERHDTDSKVACSKIFIEKEISLSELIEAGKEYLLSKTGGVSSDTCDRGVSSNTGDWRVSTNNGYRSVSTNTGDCGVSSNTGRWSVSTNTGDCSVSTNTGDWGVSTNTGHKGVSTVTGKHSIACALGRDSRAKGMKTCWLTLTEWKQVEGGWVIVQAKTVLVDGVKIKEDTFYCLRGRKVVEWKD